jgi:hypothetical protein
MPAPTDVQTRALKTSRFRNLDRSARRSVTIPDRVGPHVKLVFAEMSRLNFTYDEVEEGSGIRRASVKAWRRKNRPGLESLEAVLGFLGWDFVAVPTIQNFPPAMAGKIASLSAELNASIPETIAALVGIGVEQRLLSMDATERRAVIEARKTKPTTRRHRKSAANDNAKQGATAA